MIDTTQLGGIQQWPHQEKFLPETRNGIMWPKPRLLMVKYLNY